MMSSMSSLFVVIIFVVIPININGQQGHYQMQALGRAAQLGEFYDARSEQFLGQSVFRQRLPSSLVATAKVPWMNSRATTATKLSDKRKALNLGVTLYMSIMLGMVKINGHCSYLKEDEDSDGAISSYLTYETRTVRDTVDLFMDDIRNLINDDRLSTVEATHIVTSIEYGANAVVEFKHKNATYQDTERVEAGFSAEVKALFGLFGASAGADIYVENHYLTRNSDMTINIFGDVPADSTTPQSLEEVMEYIKKIPVLTKNYNNGKGKPVVYALFPIDAIRKKFFVRPQSVAILEEIEPTILQQLVLITDQMEETRLLVKDLTINVNAFVNCITTPDFKRVNQLYEDYLAFSESFKGQVKNTLIDVRSGYQPKEHLQDIISSYKVNPLSAMNAKIHLQEDLQNVTEKLRIYKTFILSEKTDYWNSLSTLALVNPGKNVYVLFYSPSLVQQNTTAWLQKSKLFLRLAKIPTNYMSVLDCEFPSANCSDLDKVELRQYRNGKLISKDTNGDFKFLKKVDPIQIPAFGRKEVIGALYNSKTGKFVGPSILQPNLFDVDEVMEYHHESSILFPKSFREKMEILRLPPDVAIQTFIHNVECRTNCEFIKGPLSPQKITGIYLHTVKTNVDTALALILSEGLDLTSVLDSGATHFVHQVIYGASTIVQVEVPNDLKDCTENVLKFDLDDLRLYTEATFSNSTEKNETSMEFAMKSNGSTRVYSDILNLSINFKEDKTGVKHFMKNLQQAVSSIDQGKGVPISYILEPFQNFELYFGVLKPELFEKPKLNSSDYKQIVRSYEEIMEAQSEIESWITYLQEYKSCVLPEDEEILEDAKLQFEHRYSLWLADLKEAIDEEKPREYFEIFKNLTFYKVSKSAVLNELETKLGWTMDKIKLIKAGKANNIGYLGRTSFDLGNESSLKTYILYLKRDFKQMTNLTKAWSENLFLFYSLNLPTNRLFFFDCDFGDLNCDNITEPLVHEYFKGVEVNGYYLKPLANSNPDSLNSNEEELERLLDVTEGLIYNLRDVNNNATEQFDSSLNTTMNVATEDCGASKEKLLESYGRSALPTDLSTPPRVVFSCSIHTKKELIP